MICGQYDYPMNEMDFALLTMSSRAMIFKAKSSSLPYMRFGCKNHGRRAQSVIVKLVVLQHRDEKFYINKQKMESMSIDDFHNEINMHSLATKQYVTASDINYHNIFDIDIPPILHWSDDFNIDLINKPLRKYFNNRRIGMIMMANLPNATYMTVYSHLSKLGQIDLNGDVIKPLDDHVQSVLFRSAAVILMFAHITGLHHGDFHLGNIMVSDKKMMMIDIERAEPLSCTAKKYINYHINNKNYANALNMLFTTPHRYNQYFNRHHLYNIFKCILNYEQFDEEVGKIFQMRIEHSRQIYLNQHKAKIIPKYNDFAQPINTNYSTAKLSFHNQQFIDHNDFKNQITELYTKYRYSTTITVFRLLQVCFSIVYIINKIDNISPDEFNVIVQSVCIYIEIVPDIDEYIHNDHSAIGPQVQNMVRNIQFKFPKFINIGKSSYYVILIGFNAIKLEHLFMPELYDDPDYIITLYKD